MSASRIVILAATLSVVVSCNDHGPLTETDKIDLVRLTLETAILEKEIPDFKLHKNTSTFVLSVKNIQRSWVPTLEGVSFVVLSPDSVSAKADREGDFLFLEFVQFKSQDDGSVSVYLSNRWAVSKQSKESGVMMMSGGGFGLTFKRSWGKWKAQNGRIQWIH